MKKIVALVMALGLVSLFAAEAAKQPAADAKAKTEKKADMKADSAKKMDAKKGEVKK